MDLKKKLEVCLKRRKIFHAGSESLGKAGSVLTTCGAALLGIGYILALVTDHYDSKTRKINNKLYNNDHR